MKTPESDSLVAPLLDKPSTIGPRLSNGCGNHRQKRNKRALTIRVDSFCLAGNARQAPQMSNLRIQSFRATARALQLDHSHARWSFVSWIVGLLLLVVVPVLRLIFLKTASSDTEHELVYQNLVVVVGVALSLVSFFFLSQATRKHGLRGVLFLDAAEEEVMQVQNEYETIIEKGRIRLVKCLIPALLLYIIFKVWFYNEVELEPLPFETSTTAKSLAIIIVFTTVSWIFQTTTYLYTCILFLTVCALQELKMLRFKDLLGEALDPEIYYHKYVRIIKGLQATSRRFRSFLALILTITIIGFLASMYKVVAAQRAGVDMLMDGEIVVLNLVNLTGLGLCLRSASKLSHLHRRIVKAAASMHATVTFEAADAGIVESAGDDRIMERVDRFCDVQDAWSRRAAFGKKRHVNFILSFFQFWLGKKIFGGSQIPYDDPGLIRYILTGWMLSVLTVTFLSSSSPGISVYGFILDRFFIHASVGAVLTTTWFILGRSLS